MSILNIKINMILAHDFGLGIGIDNKLPWKIKEDLDLFKHITNGHAVIMGRKTFDSLPFVRGLPNRLNIVITRDESKHGSTDGPDVIYADSIITAIFIANKHHDTAFIIGGKTIYEDSLKFVNGNIYITTVKTNHECDTHISEDFFREMQDLQFTRLFYYDYDKFIFTIHKRIKDI